MKRLPYALLLALAGCATTDKPIAIGPALTAANADELRRQSGAVLFWDQATRDRNFRRMEQLFPAHVVKAPARARPLPAGRPLPLSDAEIDAFMRDMNVAGLLVLEHGRIRAERYARGFGPDQRWTSFSVAKSFTSTLVGAAVKDGAIKSLDDPVSRYLPALAGSGYDGVTVRQVLTMTSGVRWNEDYTDPKSDVVQLFARPVALGTDPTVAYMRTLTREAAPGTKWKYKTGETNLIGSLVLAATGRPMANYMSEKIAKPAGFERDAYWQIDTAGNEVGGCCLTMTLRDYGRMGLFVLDGGKGQVPAGWFDAALSPQVGTGEPGNGYGYQWWTEPRGAATAIGIYGQQIYLMPARGIVIVTSSAWPRASDPALWDSLQKFDERVVDAIAAEGNQPATRSK